MLITLNTGLSTLPNFTFTVGGTTYSFDPSSSSSAVNNVYYFYRDGNNWEFYAKTNGTITFRGACKVDLFMLGNGLSGAAGGYNLQSLWDTSTSRYLYWASSSYGGSGGKGGTRKTTRNVVMSGSKSVTIGSTTSFGSYNSNDAGYSQANAGGNGGYVFDDSTANGIDGTNYLVGAGGGNGGHTMTDGTAQGTDTTAPGSGGTRGGGSGGSSGSSSAGNGSNASYYGSGGGGGGGWGNSNRTYSESGHGGNGNGGSGKAGFAAMRNAR